MKTPMHLDNLIDLASVARHLATRWRDGLRHPRLGREIQDAFPSLTLPGFNMAADMAWALLEPSEREEAADVAAS
ncbi:hypothetical protein NKH85_16330 [Mesorhizobium sp. M0924]|uniref:hypothetical protein n=1 Tax=unclassified Mesorhizobium TaxID=325217 RepID=UPI003334C8D3